MTELNINDVEGQEIDRLLGALRQLRLKLAKAQLDRIETRFPEIYGRTQTLSDGCIIVKALEKHLDTIEAQLRDLEK